MVKKRQKYNWLSHAISPSCLVKPTSAPSTTSGWSVDHARSCSMTASRRPGGASVGLRTAVGRRELASWTVQPASRASHVCMRR